MGVYNTIVIKCPKCGAEIDCQTKSGQCMLEVYNLEDAPDIDMLNINRHAPFECFECGKTGIEVEFDWIKNRAENRRVVSR